MIRHSMAIAVLTYLVYFESYVPGIWCTGTYHTYRRIRSRPLWRTPSVYPRTSHPFSPCNCRGEYYLLGNLPEFLCFLCFLDVLFFVFFPISRFFVECTIDVFEYLQQYHENSTAQHSAITLHKAANQVRADQST